MTLSSSGPRHGDDVINGKLVACVGATHDGGCTPTLHFGKARCGQAAQFVGNVEVTQEGVASERGGHAFVTSRLDCLVEHLN